MEKTINQVFINRAKKYSERIAIEKKIGGKWEKATWKQYYENSRAIGLGLNSIGVTKGDRVCLLSENRLEWLYTDMGSLGIGACLVPIYSTLTSEEVRYILVNSGAKAIVVDDKTQLEKVLRVSEECPDLQNILIIEDNDVEAVPSKVIKFREIMDLGFGLHSDSDPMFEKIAESIEPSDLATIVYTSGTTGIPKGAMITHKNIMAVVKALDNIEPRYAFDTDHTVPFLPLSHVFERIAGHFYGMYVGITSSYAESIDTLVYDIQDKKPTVILAVPRVCEKVYQKIISEVKRQPIWRQKVFYWGQEIGARISLMNEERQPIPLSLRFKYSIAYTLIFKKLKRGLGGRVRWMTASGAPTSKEIVRFFNAAGIMVVEGYGMTECTAPATMSNLDHYKIGTVGEALPGVEIKLADDGEILIKGDNVFNGYWKMDQETRDAFTVDGFLKTGDIGFFSEDGFLSIVDRKKDLIITSGGKNVAPQKIENLFMGDPLFSFVIVIGEGRKYLTALLNINLEQASMEAAEIGIPFGKPKDLLSNEDFLSIVNDHVSVLNGKLAKYETIKRYAIVKHEFSKESGELTATLKVKRKLVNAKYKDSIEAMYGTESSNPMLVL